MPSSKPSPRYNMLKMGNPPKPRPPFGYDARVALRKKALGGIYRGFKLRGYLMRSIAMMFIGAVVPLTARLLRPHPMPGWTLRNQPGAKWGDQYFSGMTNPHTFTNPPAEIRHFGNLGSPGGDIWDGPPTDWMELEHVHPNQFWPTGGTFFDFHKVGQADMGTGPDPRTLGRELSPKVGMNNAEKHSTFHQAYDPYWLGHGKPSLPGMRPNRNPKPGVNPGPSIDPGSMPINMPPGQPQPFPYRLLPRRQPNPYRSPSEQTQWGPWTHRPYGEPWSPEFPWPEAPVARPNPRPKPGARPKPPTGKARDPWERPAKPRKTKKPDRNKKQDPKIRVRPQERIKIRTRTPPRRNEPPGKRVKERKGKAPRLIMELINGITEGSDFMRALYKALPDKYKRRNALIKFQIKQVYLHWRELDIPHAIRSVLRDQLEDLIYGKIGQTSGKAANRNQALYDKLARSGRKLLGGDYGASNIDPIDILLDRIFGSDT